MPTKFDYAGARNAGYTDDEIMSHLSEINPDFDIQGAKNAGYSLEEINEHLDTSQNEPAKPERSSLEKGARVAAQYGLGALENAALPYELAVAPLASPEAQNVAYRETLSEDLDRLMEQKSSGVWDDQDQELLDSVIEQIKDPSKSQEFVQTANLGTRSLIEKATGLDLKPEGILEKAASWSGFIKDPSKIASLSKTGITPGKIIKAISPTGKEAFRGLGAGTALELAEQGNFGPIGTLASAVVGDVAGGGVLGAAKGAAQFAKAPRATAAKLAAKFTPKDKLAMQKEIIKDFRDSGIQADIGTLTDSELVKMAQSRLGQSGLTGSALQDLKKETTNQIISEYKSLADSLGEAKFATTTEASDTIKNFLQKARETDLGETRQIYQNANNALKQELAYVDPSKLLEVVRKQENQLKPGSLKSNEQKIVIKALYTLRRDLVDSSGNMMFAHVKDLINNKIALNDMINYEVQGGTKQLLKSIVSELDRTIISHGKTNPKFAKEYVRANKRFSEHAKNFRNRKMDTLLRESSDPEQIFKQWNTVSGIRNAKSILKKFPGGEELVNNMSRLKLDKMIGDNMVDSTTQQLKLGTFSKLLEKGKNRDIIREILPKQSFARLEKLQKNSGKLADTAQKFFNASKSGVTLTDVGVVAKAFNDVTHLLAGNPWPLVKTGSGILGARYLTKLISDPTFLKLVEESILQSEKGNEQQLMQIGERLSEMIKASMLESNRSQIREEDET